MNVIDSIGQFLIELSDSRMRIKHEKCRCINISLILLNKNDFLNFISCVIYKHRPLFLQFMIGPYQTEERVVS